MGYLLLAVMFYTVVKFSVDVWLQFRYEAEKEDRDYRFGLEIKRLGKRVDKLEATDV